jgi:hypothetical protein
MANKAAALYLNIRKSDGSWTFARPAMSSNHRLKPWSYWSASARKGTPRPAITC